MKSCTLIFPEMLTVHSEVSKGLELPALQQILRFSRESKTSHRCYEQSVLASMDFQTPALDAVPAALCKWIEQKGDTIPENCVCADPIYIRADTDHGRLVDADALAISSEEADALISTINQLLKEDGIELIKGSSQNWFMVGMDPTALMTLPVKTLVGRNMTNFLPDVKLAGNWLKLMTELQMLLFSHPVNQARENNGLSPVNGIWFWGNGHVKPPDAVNSTTAVFTDDAFSCGVARLGGVHVQGLAAISDQRIDLMNGISVDIRGMNAVIYDDYYAWRTWMEGLEQAVFSPLLAMLKSGELQTIVLDLCNGRRFVLGKSDLRKFWRSEKQIEKYTSNLFAILD